MDVTRLDPARLKQLVAVAEAGSFALAAQRCGVSQPAITKGIRALEKAAGVALFERGRAGARATRYGTLLVDHARAILAEYSLAAAELGALVHASERGVALGVSPSMAHSVLPPALAAFRKRWPDEAVAVDLGFSGPLLAGLVAGDYDIVLSAPEPATVIDYRLQRTFLFEERDALVVGADHPLAGRSDITLADLLAYPWIIPKRSSRLERIHAVFAQARLSPPSQVLRSESGELARSLLTSQPYICLMGEGVLWMDLAAGKLVTLADLGFGGVRGAYLFTRRTSSPRVPVRNLARLLQDLAG